MSDSVSIHATIMCAPWVEKRKLNSVRLKNRLSGNGIPTEIVNANEERTVWQTRKRAMDVETDRSHLLILQDDIALCDSFERLIRDAVTARPNNILSLFLCRSGPADAAAERGVNWAKTPGLWGAAMVMPVPYADAILDWSRECVKRDFKHDDFRISMWQNYVHPGMVWNPMPSLVEHAGANESSLGNSPPIDRVASWYESDLDPEMVDYTTQSDIPTSDGPYGDSESMREKLTVPLDHAESFSLPDTAHR